MRPAIPDASLFRVEVVVPTRWSDLDALRHVNNARYLTFFEDVRFAYFTKVGAFDRYDADGLGPILATTRCDFLRPVAHPQSLRVACRAVKVGTTSFELEQLVRDERGEACALGSALLVMYDYRRAAKIPLPAEIRDAIRSLDGV